MAKRKTVLDIANGILLETQKLKRKKNLPHCTLMTVSDENFSDNGCGVFSLFASDNYEIWSIMYLYKEGRDISCCIKVYDEKPSSISANIFIGLREYFSNNPSLIAFNNGYDSLESYYVNKVINVELDGVKAYTSIAIALEEYLGNKHYINTNPLKKFRNWKGIKDQSPVMSVINDRIAIKALGTGTLTYDCILPDPDFDNACVRIRINEDELNYQLRIQSDLHQFTLSIGMMMDEFMDLPIIEKLYLVCGYYDVFSLLQISDPPEGILVEDIMDEIFGAKCSG